MAMFVSMALKMSSGTGNMSGSSLTTLAIQTRSSGDLGMVESHCRVTRKLAGVDYGERGMLEDEGEFWMMVDNSIRLYAKTKIAFARL